MVNRSERVCIERDRATCWSTVVLPPQYTTAGLCGRRLSVEAASWAVGEETTSFIVEVLLDGRRLFISEED